MFERTCVPFTCPLGVFLDLKRSIFSFELNNTENHLPFGKLRIFNILIFTILTNGWREELKL